MYCDTILDAIGKTPLVKLHRIGVNYDCNFYAKCEFMNPGGSIKDRIGLQMVIDAEKQGFVILAHVELTDIYGALKYWAESYGLKMSDLEQMSDLTERAFKSGRRK